MSIFQPAVTRSGNVVVLQGRFQDGTVIGVPPPPALVVQPLGSIAPGSYTLRIALTEFAVPNPCPVIDVPFVVQGTVASAQPVPLGRASLLLLAAATWFAAATASRAARSPRCRSR